ncbi:apoptosis-inducing factor 3-like [Uranotaenia lowii]|uniref:apoptosis-inducing factor 3-like n=1 Tax=Uranotaenia lowii TaxID=190385 RepID=UPI00247A75B2|nr:apoptosis-inducing factor 3-like [Uranotaenia lowii]
MGCRSSKSITLKTVVSGPESVPPDEGFVDGVVCNDADIGEDEMKAVDLDGSKVLLVRQRGKLTAIGNKCSHYGVSLASGALGDGRVRCPWHGACFNVETGDIEDFPGLDSLPCFQVSVVKGKVRVRAKRSELTTGKRTKPMVGRLAGDNRTFVVIGGGPSGAACVETLRQEGFTGRIVMINKEPYLPYDRIAVSKAMDFEVDKKLLRRQAFYDEHAIETVLGVEASSMNVEIREIGLSNGSRISFDKVYIATGSRAKKVPIEGADLANVCVMQTYQDSKHVSAQLGENKHVVILGSSFIALEAASYCVNKVAKVTVIARGSIPLKDSFGPQIGQRILEWFKEKNVAFVLNSGLKRCIDDGNGKLESVELIDGSTLKADLCIMGVGSALYTDFLKGSGVKLDSNGAVYTDYHQETNIPGVYAGGDIAHSPLFCDQNISATLGHFGLAQYHAKIAALNMVDKPTVARSVPFFWTTLFGKSFRYAGHLPKLQDVLIEGDLQEFRFVAFYFDENDHVKGMSSCGWDPVVAQFAELLSQGRTLHRDQLKEDRFSWTKTISCADRLIN